VADLREWFEQQGGKPDTWEDDRKMMRWLTDNQAAFVAYETARRAALTGAALAERVVACDEDGLRRAVAAMPAEARARLLAALK
jgi:hypothetical protein